MGLSIKTKLFLIYMEMKWKLETVRGGILRFTHIEKILQPNKMFSIRLYCFTLKTYNLLPKSQIPYNEHAYIILLLIFCAAVI